MLAIFALLVSAVSAFFFDFNQGNQQQQQQHQQNPPVSYEDQVLNNACADYLCPDTLACVKSAQDCPCPFPKSQLRCPLPDGQYLCISKPATHDVNLNALYDDPLKGPKTRSKGLRDCGWVEKAYKGTL
ncbi:LANO_0C07118g1_1 [Lachancea nothofagi CBS 11611]|uniref:Long chronological lifespan protein 2 n=1 Tax=Lachancea nothofagi CBS 11611 TaxID=1266666 RepID=A0A1G4J8X8_9SACH|nr:LANO_0C07118g1_1 [Lachancea nothofagi CBS 11611]